MERADAAPCFLERLSEAMLQWGWRLGAEIESSHLMYRYIYIFVIYIYITSNLQPDQKGNRLVFFLLQRYFYLGSTPV